MFQTTNFASMNKKTLFFYSKLHVSRFLVNRWNLHNLCRLLHERYISSVGKFRASVHSQKLPTYLCCDIWLKFFEKFCVNFCKLASILRRMALKIKISYWWVCCHYIKIYKFCLIGYIVLLILLQLLTGLHYRTDCLLL